MTNSRVDERNLRCSILYKRETGLIETRHFTPISVMLDYK